MMDHVLPAPSAEPSRTPELPYAANWPRTVQVDAQAEVKVLLSSATHYLCVGSDGVTVRECEFRGQGSETTAVLTCNALAKLASVFSSRESGRQNLGLGLHCFRLNLPMLLSGTSEVKKRQFMAALYLENSRKVKL